MRRSTPASSSPVVPFDRRGEARAEQLRRAENPRTASGNLVVSYVTSVLCWDPGDLAQMAPRRLMTAIRSVAAKQGGGTGERALGGWHRAPGGRRTHVSSARRACAGLLTPALWRAATLSAGNVRGHRAVGGVRGNGRAAPVRAKLNQEPPGVPCRGRSEKMALMSAFGSAHKGFSSACTQSRGVPSCRATPCRSAS